MSQQTQSSYASYEAYEASGQAYADWMNKMIAKMAVCERYIPTVSINGQDAKLTKVLNLGGKLFFSFYPMGTTYQTDRAGELQVEDEILTILSMPASAWQSEEAKRIHDVVQEQYAQHS